MLFRTEVEVARAPFAIKPSDRLLFVGSCFAGNIGEHFRRERFRTEVNPYGVMYNPVSILHTIGKLSAAGRLRADVAVLTLGTNHVYRLKETGEIVDNCMKRPQRLFSEELLTVDECAQALRQSVELLRKANPEVSIVLTVSPIRYRKYGYHGSQLSKATLLLAVDQVVSQGEEAPCPSALYYFPAYEIVNDELRDYRFYAPLCSRYAPSLGAGRGIHLAEVPAGLLLARSRRVSGAVATGERGSGPSPVQSGVG